MPVPTTEEMECGDAYRAGLAAGVCLSGGIDRWIKWNKEQRDNAPWTFDTDAKGSPTIEFRLLRFIVCPLCGNKRCPHAAQDAFRCTGSNNRNQQPQLWGWNDDDELNRPTTASGFQAPHNVYALERRNPADAGGSGHDGT